MNFAGNIACATLFALLLLIGCKKRDQEKAPQVDTPPTSTGKSSSSKPNDVSGKWSWSQGPTYSGFFYIVQEGDSFSGTLDDIQEGTFNDKVSSGKLNGRHIEFTREGRFGVQYWQGSLVGTTGTLEFKDGSWKKEGWTDLQPLVAKQVSMGDQIEAQVGTPSPYQVIFCSCPGPPTSHAYVVWVEQNQLMQQTIVKSFGFEMRGGLGDLGDMLRGKNVPGGIRNEGIDALNHSTRRLRVNVDVNTFNGSQQAIMQWATTDYNLYQKNCINFAADVAQRVGLKQIPDKSWDMFPSTWMVLLIEKNT